jgi:hypothetical protein
MAAKLPMCSVNKSKVLLIQNVWRSRSTSSWGGKGNITSKFQLEYPNFKNMMTATEN